MREVDVNETSGELGSAFGGTLVGLSQLSIPKLDPLIEYFSSCIGRSCVP